MAQLAVLGLTPGVHLALGGQGQAVLPPGVHRHLPDEDVLDGLQQGGRGHGLCAPDAQPAARPVPRGVELGETWGGVLALGRECLPRGFDGMKPISPYNRITGRITWL